VADKLKAGTELDGTTYKVDLDGHIQLPYLTGEAEKDHTTPMARPVEPQHACR